MIKIIQIFTCLFLILSLSNSHAQLAQFDLVVGAGLTIGGDKIAEYPIVVTTEGISYQSTASIKAGKNGIYFFGGMVHLTNFPLGLQITWNRILSTGGDVEGLESEFTRNSIDILPYFTFDRFRLGIGLSYYYNVKFIDDADFGGGYFHRKVEYKFTDSHGYFLEIDYVWNKSTNYYVSFITGVRFTKITYEPIKLDGNNVGIFLNLAINIFKIL